MTHTSSNTVTTDSQTSRNLNPKKSTFYRKRALFCIWKSRGNFPDVKLGSISWKCFRKQLFISAENGKNRYFWSKFRNNYLILLTTSWIYSSLIIFLVQFLVFSCILSFCLLLVVVCAMRRVLSATFYMSPRIWTFIFWR